MAGVWVGVVIVLLASAALGIAWISRVVSARRRSTAADVYAEREIARARAGGG